MRTEDLRIGMSVNNPHGFAMEVVGIFKDGTVYCDFEGNEGDVWEYDSSELTEI